MPDGELERTVYAVKRLSSSFRGASACGPRGPGPARRASGGGRGGARAVRRRARRAGPASRFRAPKRRQRRWLLTPASGHRCRRPAPRWPRSRVPRAPRSSRSRAATAPSPKTTPGARPPAALLHGRRLARPDGDLRRRAATAPRRWLVRYFDAKTFTPILLLPEDPAGEARIALSGGPFARAAVENLASGVRRDFELKGAPALTLDASKGPLAVVLTPAARAGGDTKAAVDVGAIRGLTADEIIARERAWEAGQREKFQTYTALMDTSLIFRVAEFQNSIDLTIRGPFFWERGKPPDWQWNEFFLNGVRWKGRTIPKLPILEPDKVTTLPLDIRLTEEYVYELAGETEIDGRPAYAVDFRPKGAVTDKPIYRGRAWIDRETFALLRREIDPAQPQGRHALERADRVLQRRPRRLRDRAAPPDPGEPGLLDRGPDDDGHALHPDVRRHDRPAGLRDAAAGGLRVGRPDGPRHGLGPALPHSRSQRARPSGSSRTSSRAGASSASPGRSTSARRSTRCRCSASSTSTSTCGARTSSSRSSSPERSSSATTRTPRFSAAASTSAPTSSPWPFPSSSRTTSTAWRSKRNRSSTCRRSSR